MLLPLATAYVLVGRMKPVLRILLGYAALVILAGMVMTFSRGGWMAVTVALLALLGILTFHRNHRLPAFLLLVFLAGGGQFLSPSICQRRSVTFNAWARPQTADNSTFPSAATSGRRRDRCGGTIFGGESVRRITIIVSGNIAPKVFN